MGSLTKQNSEFLTPKTLRDRVSGLNAMKSLLSVNHTTPALEKSFKGATKLRLELPTVKRQKLYHLWNLYLKLKDLW